MKKGRKGKIVWGSVDKRWAVPPYLYADLSIEHIIVFRKPGKKRDLHSMEERQAEEYNRIPKEKFLDWANPVWEINSPHNKKHPATFPSSLVNRLIKMYSLKNDIVLDPFCGIGTTVKEAIKLKRNAIGYEINKTYINDLIDEYNLKRKGDRYSN
ncbi:hypothetical protein BHF71_10660 [Vulcanibacillus modesticaldus]|uniref:DNA methylase N-4/N-6 domain-containing protein n=1 Tax=Vulcanibacillus modesticaldus TaxID=337097 RepID=A0A1D2YT43_9BACI|nr:hypothetical protein BHF71_10660 [Vulcanibacillus modesticaldus]